jgi:hypothetical protein
VATASLTLTDRIAIRIYVNVDTREVTLHTEDNHLCQVVTTFSKGMTSLNNLTKQVQYLTTGTSGTNFAIVSSNDTHTFNLPTASATNTGKLSSSDWSNFNTAYNDTIVSASVSGTTTKTLTLTQQDAGTITASWTDLNTDAVSSVFGRTGAVVAANGDYTTTQVTEGTNLYYTEARVNANANVAANTAARHAAVTIGTANGLSLSTQALSLAAASTSTTGALTSTDWNTFNGKQAALNGTGFVKISGTTISYDNSTYLTTSAASSTYLPLAGGTLTGPLSGTSASFSSSVTANGLYANAGNSARFYRGANDYYWSINNDSNNYLNFATFAANGTAYGTNPKLIILDNGAATFTSNSNSTITNVFQNTNTTDTNSRNYFNVVAGNVTTSIQSIHNDHSYINVTNNLYFQSGGGVKMTMLSGGNVGIGTSSPTNNLSILGADQTSNPTLGTNSGKFGMFNGVGSGTYGMIMGVINNGNSYIQVQRIDGTATAYNLLLQPSGGNVGIGTSSPTDFGSTYTTLCIDNATNGGVLDLRKNGVRGLTIAVDGSEPRIEARVSGQPLVFYTNNGGTIAARLTIASTGLATFSSSVAVGDSVSLLGELYWGGFSSGQKVRAYPTGSSGSATLNFAFWNGSAWGIQGSLTSAGVWSTTGGGTSDARTKDEIDYNFDNGIESILKLQPTKFKFKISPNKQRRGFIAQDVLTTIPDLVLGDGEKENGTYGLDYDGILALAVKAIQEQQAQIEELKAKILSL